jgi:hypothetical protein
MARATPRKWVPKIAPEKYVGNLNEIVSRSSWETRFLNWLDANKNVVLYSSETLVIPYISPIDNKPHRYFVDFIAKIKNRNDEIKTYAIEIKPKHETLPPVMKKNKATYAEALKTFLINQAKWKAATAFCRSKGIEFIVLTEDDLGI